MKTLKIGIAGYDRMKARTMAIARGEHKPGRGEPKVWFTSVESFAESALAAQSGVADNDCSGETGLSDRTGWAFRAKQVEPVTDSEDDVAVWARGAQGGEARHGGTAGVIRSSEAGRVADFGTGAGCVTRRKLKSNCGRFRIQAWPERKACKICRNPCSLDDPAGGDCGNG